MNHTYTTIYRNLNLGEIAFMIDKINNSVKFELDDLNNAKTNKRIVVGYFRDDSLGFYFFLESTSRYTH